MLMTLCLRTEDSETIKPLAPSPPLGAKLTTGQSMGGCRPLTGYRSRKLELSRWWPVMLSGQALRNADGHETLVCNANDHGRLLSSRKCKTHLFNKREKRGLKPYLNQSSS
ncbi:hypothetical protein NXS19_012466 [Fusarium pseudograminearum]|nr:hypothetical protein NXS19_012466 [Fusarium pseudograminearum]